jgi:outer membrane protein W
MQAKKIFYWIILLTVICFITQDEGFAQRERWYGAATYQISFPLGDTKDYTNATSFRGFGLDFRYTFEKNTSVGLTLGWNVFEERRTETAQLGTQNPGAITGTQDRYLNAFPIMANVHYYFGERGGVRPYVGLNAGGIVMNQRFEIGIVALQNDGWEWGIAPEVGIIIPMDREWAIMVNGKYNYAFTGESVFETDINHSYLGLNIGFVWQQ